MTAAKSALILLACCVSSVATSAQSKWTLVESGSIRVITNDSLEIATGVLDELVLAQSMLRQIASAHQPMPLHVFALRDRKSLVELAPKHFKRGDIHTFGFSYTGPHAGFIAMRTDRPSAATVETLRHEYAHVLTAALSPEAPAWLDEGLSEFWSSIIVDENRVVVGRPVAKHLALLGKRKWLTMDAMVNQRRGSLPSNPAHVELFYAQAWAMVHYLMLGAETNDVAAFMPSLSTMPEQLHSTVQQYVAAGQLREVTVTWARPARPHATVVMLTEARAMAERANMLVSGEQPQSALAVARQALAIDPNEPLALEVIGTYHFLNNQPDEARSWLSRALATGVTSHRAALYLSLLSVSPAERERFLTMAVMSKPDSVVAWQRLGAIFESDGRISMARRWCEALLMTPLSRLLVRPAMTFCPGGRQ